MRDLIRSLTRLLSPLRHKCAGRCRNVSVYRQISSRARTLENRYNNHLIRKHGLFCYENVKFYSRTSDEIKTVMNFYEFSEVESKNKKAFHQMVQLFDEKFPSRIGVVDFICSALRHMKEFGVHDDLETYKKLLDLMPKGKFVPTNIIQAEGVYFPREQDCITELLCQMEEFGVMPDVEMCDMLRNIFGSRGYPTRKYHRMMYWMPKFKNKSPWPVPMPLPSETFSLAKLAIERITSVDLQTEICAYRTEEVGDSIDKTWIVSGQSPEQKRLLQKHDRLKPVIVEGGDHVWLRNERISYFVLKSEDVPYVWKEPKFTGDVENLPIRYLNPNYEDEEEEEQSVHEQEDGKIYAVCATGTSSKDSLLSWIRLLEKNGNPILEDLAVLFRFKKTPQEAVPFTEELTTREDAK